jgi:hypothetical protein
MFVAFHESAVAHTLAPLLKVAFTLVLLLVPLGLMRQLFRSTLDRGERAQKVTSAQ